MKFDQNLRQLGGGEEEDEEERTITTYSLAPRESIVGFFRDHEIKKTLKNDAEKIE